MSIPPYVPVLTYSASSATTLPLSSLTTRFISKGPSVSTVVLASPKSAKDIPYPTT